MGGKRAQQVALLGQPSNFLTEFEVDNRVLLHNGHHRVYAMRSLGITHAPCMAQSTTRLDELELVPSNSVCRDNNVYIGASRPPLFKDYFDTNIRHEYEVCRARKVVDINVEINEFQVRL